MMKARTHQMNAKNAVSELLAKAHRINNLNYAGDISPQDAYQFLLTAPGAIVDVRTTPEWQFTGVPDLSESKGKLLTISWKTYPTFALNPYFIDTLAASESIVQDTPLFFMCRSGGRSLDAAIAMTEAGFEYCFNIASGFEGEPDQEGHRGTHRGWKAAQLPWKQG